MEESAVALCQTAEVVRVHALLVGHAAAAHAVDQRGQGRLQVDDQVRHRRLRRELVEHGAVEPVLGVVEVEAREQRVLVEQEVTHRERREQAGLSEAAQLLDALEQKAQLGRQRVAPHVFVEQRQEGVVAGGLEQQFATPGLGQPPRERGLAGADRPLDHHMAVARHAHPGITSRFCPTTPGSRSRSGPWPGMARSGASWLSGSSTKARPCMRGCGTVSVGVSMRWSP